MSLQHWLNSKWLKSHKTSSQEITSLVEIAKRDLKDASVEKISPDWRLNMAFNAALKFATIALNICGYRSSEDGHHQRTIDSLKYTIGANSDFISQFQAFRKKRSISSYDRAGTVSEREVAEAIRLANDLQVKVREWVKKNHPSFISEI